MTENEVFASVLAALRTAGCEKHDAAEYTRVVVPIVNRAIEQALEEYDPEYLSNKAGL